MNKRRIYLLTGIHIEWVDDEALQPLDMGKWSQDPREWCIDRFAGHVLGKYVEFTKRYHPGNRDKCEGIISDRLLLPFCTGNFEESKWLNRNLHIVQDIRIENEDELVVDFCGYEVVDVVSRKYYRNNSFRYYWLPEKVDNWQEECKNIIEDWKLVEGFGEEWHYEYAIISLMYNGKTIGSGVSDSIESFSDDDYRASVVKEAINAAVDDAVAFLESLDIVKAIQELGKMRPGVEDGKEQKESV
jgi:hypothetical protein